MGTIKSIEKKATQFLKMNNKNILVLNCSYVAIFYAVFKSLESALREALNLIPTRPHEIRSLSKQETYISSPWQLCQWQDLEPYLKYFIISHFMIDISPESQC